MKTNYAAALRNINLRELYPVSRRYYFYCTAPWLIALGLVIAPISATDIEYILNGREYFALTTVNDAGALISLLLIVALTIKVIHTFLYLRTYKYFIRSGNLVISRGILLKQEVGFPLNRITDIYIDHTWDCFLFGLCHLHVLTPTAGSQDTGRIEGLSFRAARALRERLFRMLAAGRGAATAEITSDEGANEALSTI